MVQDYPGSNNLNYFRKEGQFGSRQGNRYGIGKDCGAGRYVETMPEWWLKYVFKKELIAMVPKVIVEDEEAEPQWIPCDIPVHVINGTLGLSTAYSVYIPNYHPLDVINWIFAYLHESEKPTLIPWFRGFTGNIEVVVKKKATPKDSTFLEEDEDPIVQGLTLKTEGHFTILQERIKNFREEKNGEILTIEDKVYDLKITEIPIGISIFKYRKWLEDLIVEKKIEDIDDKMTSSDTPNIIVRGWRKEPTAKTLKLIKCAGISNISLINDQAIPLSYTSIDNVLEDYCSSMKELYYQFHEVSCKKLEKEIEDLQNLVKLITLIVQEIIIITKVSLSTIHTSLEKHQIPLQIYEKLNITSLSEEGIQRHTKKYESVIEEHRLLQQQSPIKIWEDSLLRFQKALLKREEFAKLEI
jgi:DNA topoisomerase-2